MSKWYDKYLSIYGKPYDEVSDSIIDEIKMKLGAQQSENPLVSIVVIAYNEERRLAACLWSLSELQTRYPIEILGVNNNSKDRTEDVYRRLYVFGRLVESRLIRYFQRVFRTGSHLNKI